MNREFNKLFTSYEILSEVSKGLLSQGHLKDEICWFKMGIVIPF